MTDASVLDAEAKERLAKALKKYADIKARAEHPNTPPAEREVCYSMAARILADFEIDELELESAKGVNQAVVAAMVRLGATDEVTKDQRVGLAATIADAFDCMVVLSTKYYQGSGESRMPGHYAQVIGYKMDVNMVRDLYYLIGVDLVMGLNIEIMNGNKKVASQQSYAQDFVWRIRERIHDEVVKARKQRVAEGVSTSTALVLRDRKMVVKDFYDEMFKDTKLGNYKSKRLNYDPAAGRRGRERANNTDLGQTPRVGGSGVARGIGSGPRRLNP